MLSYLSSFINAHTPKKWRIAIKSVLFAGSRVHCPLCGGHFRTFLPFGIQHRPNARCLRCDSLERHRLLWLYLRNKTNLFSDHLRVLHFAPEYCLEKNLKSMPNLDYISTGLKRSLAMVKMDITKIIFQDNCFDAIICNHVLEHVIDDRRAMAEMYRVLKPNGWAILTVPVDPNREKTFEDFNMVSPEGRLRAFGQSDHVRIYGRDFKDRLQKTGFDVRVDNYAAELPDDQVKMYGLEPKGGLREYIDIYFCTKSGK